MSASEAPISKPVAFHGVTPVLRVSDWTSASTTTPGCPHRSAFGIRKWGFDPMPDPQTPFPEIADLLFAPDILCAYDRGDWSTG